MSAPNVDHIEAALARPWADLQQALETSPSEAATALRRLLDRCRSVDGLTPEQGEALARATEQQFSRVVSAAWAGGAGSADGDGYEGLSDLAKLIGDGKGLRRLILAATSGAVLMSGVAYADPVVAAPSSAVAPAPIAMDASVEAAANVATVQRWGPSLQADLFERAMAFTEKWEGGRVDDPVDRGGRTNMGVTQKTLDAWRDAKGLTEEFDVWEITRDEAREIYKANYWDAIRGDELPERVALAVFDIAVNSGPRKAIRMLQAALGVSVDGGLGPKTLEAVYTTNPHDLFNKLNDDRAAFYEAIMENDVTQEKYRNGWFNRLNDLRYVGAHGGYETKSDDWRDRLRDNPATDDPFRTLTDEDFHVIGL